VGNLSGGNQQKVALARWLATRPAVLVLDEPTQGVDVGAKAEIHRLMVELAEQGLAILMISSELPEILGMSDRIAVMRGGTIVGTLEREAANQESLAALALGPFRGDAPLADRSASPSWPGIGASVGGLSFAALMALLLCARPRSSAPTTCATSRGQRSVLVARWG